MQLIRCCQRLSLSVIVIMLVGCQSARNDDAPASIPEEIPGVENVEDYLAANVGTSAFGGNVFCVYEPLNAPQGAEGKIYLWALCREYVLEQTSLVAGSGVSLPVVLLIREKNDHREVVGHLVPRNGTHYGPDVRATFPPSAWPQIMPQGEDGIYSYNRRADRLGKEAEAKARLYYDR
jgi:hypothetical protein